LATTSFDETTSFDFASLESLVVSEDSLSLLLSFFAFFAGGMLRARSRQVATFFGAAFFGTWRSRQGCVACQPLLM
jgi:hypothetical protein